MGFFRCRMDFTAQNAYGWTEHFYRPSSETDITTAMDKLTDLAVARGQLLGRGILISQRWVSDESIYRDSIVLGPLALPDSGIYNPNYNPGFGLDPDLPSHGFLVRYTCGLTGQYHVTRILRGAPDQIQTFPAGPDIGNAAFSKAFKAYAKLLITDHWCIKFLRTDAGFARLPIKDITVAAGVLSLQVLNHGLVVGDKLRVGGVFGTGTAPNGVFKVLSVPDVNTFVISTNWGGFVAGDVKGYIHKIAYQPVQITDSTILRESTRHTGLPTVRPRGRRQRKRI